jgi:hypothetical protein
MLSSLGVPGEERLPAMLQGGDGDCVAEIEARIDDQQGARCFVLRHDEKFRLVVYLSNKSERLSRD